MKLSIVCMNLIVTLFIMYPLSILALPAFPGAEGMGASATGARGYSGTPTVRFVTNLKNSGSGSLRDAVEGNRDGTYVVFRTSGIINLNSDIDITSDNITIAGETSPGGISIEGGGVYLGTASSGVKHIIIRHLRFRPGTRNYDGDGGNNSQEAFGIWRSSNVIIDHCSMSWAGDEVVAFTTYTGGSEVPFNNVTLSWCFITEGLTSAPGGEGDHGYGLLFNAKGSSQSSVTVHHSVFAHFQNRIPRADGNILVDWRNNIAYDWYKMFNSSYLDTGKVFANHVGNYAKPGPNSDACYPTYRSGDALVRNDGQGDLCDQGDPYEMLYMASNYGCVTENRKGTGGWGAVCGNTGGSGLASEAWRRSTPFPTTDISVTTSTMNAEYMTTVLANAGATKPGRDAVDSRIAMQIANGTGGFIDDVNWESDRSSWGSFPTPPAQTDSDNDGMGDDWEIATFGNLSQSAVNDHDNDGYHNIEEYFHYLNRDSRSPVITGVTID